MPLHRARLGDRVPLALGRGLGTQRARFHRRHGNAFGRARRAREFNQGIELTEEAVTEIGKRFRVLVGKAGEQTEAAMSLLTSGGRTGVMSLPEFIQAYDSQLVNVTSHMTSFSAAAEAMASHQKRVSEHAEVMKGTIDGLRNMASQISRIALDGSVAMTSQTLNPRDFVEMTDRIRAISAEAHELTRKTRASTSSRWRSRRRSTRSSSRCSSRTSRAVRAYADSGLRSRVPAGHWAVAEERMNRSADESAAQPRHGRRDAFEAEIF
jgi:hypothetical protein